MGLDSVPILDFAPNFFCSIPSRRILESSFGSISDSISNYPKFYGAGFFLNLRFDSELSEILHNGAECFFFADIRELINLDDAMDDEELHFGPNGGLVFCMEHLAENFDWLEEQLGDVDDDYVLFDCPGLFDFRSTFD